MQLRFLLRLDTRGAGRLGSAVGAVLEWLEQPWNLFDCAAISLNASILILHLRCNADVLVLRGLAAVQVRDCGKLRIVN